jgi:Right handed beta helix region
MMRNNRIEGNHAARNSNVGRGGGVSVQVSKAVKAGGSISRNDIGITTGAGAGVYVNAMSEVRLEGVSIRGNTGSGSANAGGSGIHAESSRVVVASTIIAANRSGSSGISVGPLGSYVVFHCTISDNSVEGVKAQSYITVANSTIAQEPLGIEVIGARGGQLYNNVFFATGTNAAGVTPDSSNLSLDPKLTMDLHLSAESLLIDAARTGPVPEPEIGTGVAPPVIDIDGESRSLAGRAGVAALPDIGADEYHP